jgi:hypothetical protein
MTEKKERTKKLLDSLSDHDKKLLQLMIKKELSKRKKK